MFEIIFNAVIKSIIGLLVKAGLEDRIKPLKSLLRPSEAKQRIKALELAFEKAKNEFHNAEMVELFEVSAFQEFVIASLLDPEQRFNFDDAAKLLGDRFDSQKRNIKRFLNIMENHLIEDPIWGEILDRFHSIRSQKEIYEQLEQNNAQASTFGIIHEVSEQLKIIQGNTKDIEPDTLAEKISLAVVQKLFLNAGIKDAKTLKELYLKDVAWEANKLPWTIMNSDFTDEQKSKVIQLDEIYTDLDTCEVKQIDREDEYNLLMKNIKDRELVPVLEMIETQPRLLVMGNPGSGKSTFVKHVVYILSQAGLGGEYIKRLAPWSHGALLPVFIELRHFSAWHREQNTKKTSHHCLTHYLKTCLFKSSNYSEFWTDFYDKLSSDNPTLIIFDGLDEVPRDHRGFIVECVNDFVGFYKNNRYVVTCRPYAYIGQPFQLLNFYTATLAPFSEDKIKEYIKKWYDLHELKGYFKRADAVERANKLVGAIRAKGLRDLAERPLLLTIMVQIHSTKKRLPDDRTELYADAVNLFLERWEGHVDEENNILDVLNLKGLRIEHLRAGIYKVAYNAHQKSKSYEEAADIDESDLKKWMAPYLDNDAKKAEQFVNYIHERAGLLIRHKTQAYQFPHRSFQEFLAACYLLLDDKDFIGFASNLATENYDLWREVIILAAGYAARTDRIGSAVGLVNEICSAEYKKKNSTKRKLMLALLAAECIVEIGERSLLTTKSGPNALRRVQKWLANSTVENKLLSSKERTHFGVILARLGDPRENILTVENMSFCWAPGGDFWMGEGKEMHLNIELKDDYWAAQYPVSNSQFKEFVADAGYTRENLWLEAKKAGFWKDGQFKGRYDPDWRAAAFDFGAPYNLENHPAVGVSWYEALAFCRWLDARFRESLGAWRIRLISEAEWEKAARGGLLIPERPVLKKLSSWPFKHASASVDNPQPQREYPWIKGELTENANFDETGIGHPSALGCFSAGQSPVGCEEMSGNVWEWTRSNFEQYPYKTKSAERGGDSDKSRVLRGGSYHYNALILRCASRVRYNPYSWYDYFGFRVVLAPH